MPALFSLGLVVANANETIALTLRPSAPNVRRSRCDQVVGNFPFAASVRFALFAVEEARQVQETEERAQDQLRRANYYAQSTWTLFVQPVLSAAGGGEAQTRTWDPITQAPPDVDPDVLSATVVVSGSRADQQSKLASKASTLE